MAFSKLANIQYSRLKNKTLVLPGETPTIPIVATAAGDITEEDYLVLGQFNETDILNGEIVINTADDRVFLRSDDSILEFNVSSGTAGAGLTSGSGTTYNINRVDLGGVLRSNDTIIKGATDSTSSLFLGGNANGENLIQLAINAESFNSNNLVGYTGSNIGTFVNSNPGGFQAYNNISLMSGVEAYTSIGNGGDTAYIRYNDNRIVDLYVSYGIPSGLTESFYINAYTFSEGIDFTGSGDPYVDVLDIYNNVNFGIDPTFISAEYDGDLSIRLKYSQPVNIENGVSGIVFNENLYYTGAVANGAGGSIMYSNQSTLTINEFADHLFTDGRVVKKGIEYNGDYSADFATHSLIDKNYVDNAIIGIGLTSGSGTTYNSGKFDLGGVLTQNAIIEGGGNNLSLGTTGSQLTYLDINAIQGIETYSSGNDDLVVIKNPGINSSDFNKESIDGKRSKIDQSLTNISLQVSEDNGLDKAQIIMSYDEINILTSTNGGVPSGLGIDEVNGISLSDNINGQGIVYEADYSATFVDESLITKRYVDNAIINTSTFSVDYIDFNTAYTPTQQEGRVHWDQDYGTLDVDLEGNNINLKVGLDNLYYIKNQSGSTINKGSVVRASGTLGSSGRILGSLMIANGSVPHYYTLGIAGENILDGEDGYVYEFGLIRGLDTSGTASGETWVDGDILYVSSTISGGLTKVEPIEPNLKIQMAIVVEADNVNGSIFVRPSLSYNLGDLHNVETTGQSEGDLISYNQIGGGYWQYTKNLNGDYTISGTLSATAYYGDGSNLTGIGGGHEIYSGTGPTALPQQPGLRFEGYLQAVDDPINGETKVDLDPSKTTQFNSVNIIDVNGVMELSLDQNKIYMGNANNLAEQKTLTDAFSASTTPLSPTMFHTVSGQTELFVPQGYIITGDSQGVGYADTVSNALASNAIPVSSIFKVDISGNVALNVPTGYIIRGDVNGDGIAEPLISGANKILATDNSGNEYEADLVNYLDLLTASGITSNGILNTFDLSGTARGVLGGYKITDIVIENTTANVVTINIGSINGGNDIANNVEIGANDFIDVPVGKTLFSKTIEQDLYVSSSNWNSADLTIKISIKKIY